MLLLVVVNVIKNPVLYWMLQQNYCALHSATASVLGFSSLKVETPEHLEHPEVTFRIKWCENLKNVVQFNLKFSNILGIYIKLHVMRIELGCHVNIIHGLRCLRARARKDKPTRAALSSKWFGLGPNSKIDGRRGRSKLKLSVQVVPTRAGAWTCVSSSAASAWGIRRKHRSSARRDKCPS